MEGSGASCVLIDPKINKHFISCRLEFKCTNNTAEYEALVQGLKKAIELKVKNLKVYGDSKSLLSKFRTRYTVFHHIWKLTKMKFGIY